MFCNNPYFISNNPIKFVIIDVEKAYYCNETNQEVLYEGTGFKIYADDEAAMH